MWGGWRTLSLPDFLLLRYSQFVCQIPKSCQIIRSTRFIVFFFPETKGRVSLLRAHVLLNIADDGLQTLEETDAAFGDNVTDRERERMESICRELGLPVRALLNA
jgi:hypothetical protein